MAATTGARTWKAGEFMMRLTAGSVSGATSGIRILYQRLSWTCWMAPAALSDTLRRMRLGVHVAGHAGFTHAQRSGSQAAAKAPTGVLGNLLVDD